MNSELYLREKTDHEMNEEKLFSPVTLDKEELTKSDNNSHLLGDKKDTDFLESIQNYAQRIKSFLGWESKMEEEQKFENQGDEAKVELNSTHSSYVDNINVDEVKEVNKEDCLGAVSTGGKVEDNNCEDDRNYLKSDRRVNNILPDESANAVNEESEEKLVESNGRDNNQQHKTLEKESIEMNVENNNINLTASKRGTLENISITSNSTDLNKDAIHVKVGKPFHNDSMMNASNDIQVKDDKPIREINGPLEETEKETELRNVFVSQSVPCDPCSTDKNREFKQGENDNSETEFQKLTPVKEELDSLCISDLKTGSGTKSLDSPSADKRGSTSDLLKYKNENSKLIASPLEKDLLPEIEEQTVENTGCKNNYTSKFSENGIGDGINENNYAEDQRSEDSLDLDEALALQKNLPKHYVKEVRRLSRDIVKDVIESARNSVHELYTTENLDITSPAENIKNEDFAKDKQEFYFNNKKLPEEDPLEFNKKTADGNFDSKSDYKNEKTELELDIVDDDTTCGCSFFKPKWIQKYATPKAYLVLFSIIGVIHGCYYTYVVAIMSTLEKRYAFKTKVSGTLLLADEITPLILGILVGYIGGKTHRPRMVAIGMFMSAACCFISGLPYLIYGKTKHGSYTGEKYESGPLFCESGFNNTDCNSDDQPPTLSVVGIFLLASFLKGFATLSYYVIGMSYMDDIIKRKNSPMYFAIALALRLLGPLVGFLMSSGFLKYYENPVYDPGFGPDDPRWIGAWWIGFFLQGILLVIFSIPIAFFPRRLPSQKKIEKVADMTSEDGFKSLFTGLLSALKRLGKNPVFIVLIINTTMKIFGHFGHAIMLPKYMENQFRLSASEASLFSGAITVVCIIISTIVGGFLIWKFRPKIKVILAGMIVVETILCVGFLILMIPRCQISEMLHFGMNDDGLILNSVCNKNCDCSTSSFTPFCGPDGKTLYFSPCYAGCTDEISSSSKMIKEYSNCSCVDQQQLGTTITEGFCPDENCSSQMIFYLIILFFLVTISNLFTVAATMILLRSVHPNDKSVALGTFETFICLFGFIPFPVIYGALVDSACLVWEKSCGETGNCWFYDMEKYDYLLHGASALFCSFSVVCLITLYFLSSRIRSLYDEEEEEKEEETDKYIDIKLDTVSGTVSVTKL